MKNTTKSLVMLAATAFAVFAMALGAQAAVTADLKVTGIRVADSGDVVIYTAKQACVEEDANPFIRKSAPNYRRVLETALGAYLSGSLIAVETNAATCELLVLRIGLKEVPRVVTPAPQPTPPRTTPPTTPPGCPSGQKKCPGDDYCIANNQVCR